MRVKEVASITSGLVLPTSQKTRKEEKQAQSTERRPEKQLWLWLQGRDVQPLGGEFIGMDFVLVAGALNKRDRAGGPREMGLL